MDQFCIHCGKPLSPDSAFCTSCGAKVQVEDWNEAADESSLAEIQQDTLQEDVNQHDKQIHPGQVKFIAESFCHAKITLIEYLKNPKKMIPLLILSAVWMVLSILPALGFNPLPVRLLSFITFSQGGMYGGFWGAVGGVIGKALFAYFFSAILIPLTMGKVSTIGFFSDMKRNFTGLHIQTLKLLAPLLAGIGVSLIIFNFLSGNASFVNSMPGIIGVVLAIRAFLRQSGFLWGLLLSVSSKLSKGKIPSGPAVKRVVAGYAAGSLAGVALSVVRVSFLPYIFGLLFIIAAIIINIVAKSRRGAVPA